MYNGNGRALFNYIGIVGTYVWCVYGQYSYSYAIRSLANYMQQSYYKLASI